MRLSGIREATRLIWGWEYNDPCISEEEEDWRGGVADFGQSWAAVRIETCRAYRKYVKEVRQSVEAALGPAFTLYRAMPQAQLNHWVAAGGPSRSAGFTFNREVADNWKNFALNHDLNMIVVEGRFKPQDILMRGSSAESELVVSLNKIKPKALKIVG